MNGIGGTWNGGPRERGGADAYYHRARSPHYFREGRCITDLTPEQAAEYEAGYAGQFDRKDWGDWDEPVGSNGSEEPEEEEEGGA